jgi:hypothetical protein
MSELSFRSTIEIRGINLFVRVSKAQAAQLRPNWRKPLPVRLQVNGQPDRPWRTNLVPSGDGEFCLYLPGVVRQASHSGLGDTVAVRLNFDDAYRGGPAGALPPSFSQALAENPSAPQSWDALIPSRKKEALRYISLSSSRPKRRPATSSAPSRFFPAVRGDSWPARGTPSKGDIKYWF